ncbi:MAG: Gfo/Idh/MocA family oxidoreductase [Phycisphaerae bacterium]|nr:Gfo/Idh/MocA family oxidoreductase [Phycisphaerae bacterium]
MSVLPRSSVVDAVSRRRFLRTAAGVSLAAAWMPAASWARVLGANDRLNIGVIGTGGMGTAHVQSLVGKSAAENIKITMVCDLYRRRLRNAVKLIGGSESDGVMEYEKVLDNKDVNAVLIATPDHWHTKIAIEAMQSGKDVYVEKPLSHTIEQAIACRDAVRKTGRVLQVGPQRTSEARWWKAGEAIRAGRIGPVVWSQGSYCRNSREGQFNWTIDPDAGPESKGDGFVNWDRWLGHQWNLAPKIPWNPDHFFRFRKYYAYNGGVATDLMYHWLSPLLLAIHGQNGAYPRRVMSGGGQYIEKDGRDIADTMLLTADYDTHSVFLSSVMVNDVGVPEMIRGQKGQMEPDAKGWKISEQGAWKDDFRKSNGDMLKADPGKDQANFLLEAGGDKDGRDHENNWLDSIRGKAKPNCNVELGCAVMVAIKLGVESYRQSKVFSWDAKAEKAVAM